MMEVLIEAGADLNIQEKDGQTPLIFCVQDEEIAQVRSLLEEGANVNIKDQDGRTAIMFCGDNYQEMIKIQIDAGADINYTLLQCASGPAEPSISVEVD